MAAAAMVPTNGRQEVAQSIEQVLIDGDLARLTAEQRLDYYRRVCESLGLNPLTRPFQYIILDGKLTLYARKDAAEQLRDKHGVSITDLRFEYTGDVVIVTATARDAAGRVDSDVGAVPLGEAVKGLPRAAAVKKAVTQAKRRVTLSICGLGMLDETEIESIPSASAPVIDEQPQAPPRETAAQSAPERQITSERVTPTNDPGMAALRTELAEWFERYPDAKARAEEAVRAANAGGGLSDVAVRKAVTALRQRAADEEAQRQDAAQEAAATDMSPSDRLAGALEVTRKAVEALSKKGGPNAGDYEGMRVVLRELQRCDPLPDDTPPEQIPPRLLLDALRTRLAVADAGGGEDGARAVRQEIDDAIPF